MNRLKILDEEQKRLRFEKFEFNSNKNFNNLFFENKDIIINRIDNFNNNIHKYKKLGIPHTLGFLFHGIPGTGKTSCIKAIANYTNRSIISINMKDIINIYDLIKIFNDDNAIPYCNAPLEKRLYVFEEIDCVDCFLSRDLKKEDNSINKQNELLDVVLSSIHNKDKDKNKYLSNKITIGEILEVLDGIIECRDRFCIFTTNNIQKIDNALLRPGRIDEIIEFKKLRKVDIEKLYQLWFDRKISDKELNKIKDYTISQAEFGKLCFENINNPNKVIQSILHL